MHQLCQTVTDLLPTCRHPNNCIVLLVCVKSGHDEHCVNSMSAAPLIKCINRSTSSNGFDFFDFLVTSAVLVEG